MCQMELKRISHVEQCGKNKAEYIKISHLYKLNKELGLRTDLILFLPLMQ